MNDKNLVSMQVTRRNWTTRSGSPSSSLHKSCFPHKILLTSQLVENKSGNKQIIKEKKLTGSCCTKLMAMYDDSLLSRICVRARQFDCFFPLFAASTKAGKVSASTHSTIQDQQWVLVLLLRIVTMQKWKRNTTTKNKTPVDYITEPLLITLRVGPPLFYIRENRANTPWKLN